MSEPTSDESLEARIGNLPFWKTSPRLTRIDDGRTNTNFRADVGEATYFVRFGEELPHHFVFRENEAAAAATAAEIGIAPAVRFAEKGYMITDFVAGKAMRVEDGVTSQQLQDIAGLLRRLHEASASAVTNDFDLREILNGYLARLGPTLADDVRSSVDKILANTPTFVAQCLIHGDVLPNNFIQDGADLWLVDWEYAGLGQPAVDLAMAASNFELSAGETRDLVDAHGLCSYAEVTHWIPVLMAREALWSLVQIEQVGYVGDLKEYSELCLKRLTQCD